MTIIKWDIDNTGSNLTLSSDGLTVTSGASWGMTIATEGKIEGKWYWETTLVDTAIGATGRRSLSGVTTRKGKLNVYLGSNSNDRSFQPSVARIYPVNIAYGQEMSTGDVLSVLLNMEVGTLEFWNNGVSMGIAFTDIKNLGEVFASESLNTTGAKTTTNFGATPFKYNIPEGFRSYDGNQRNDYGHKILLLGEDSKVKKITSENFNPIQELLTSNDNLFGKIESNDSNIDAYKAFNLGQNYRTYISGTYNSWLSIELNESIYLSEVSIDFSMITVNNAPTALNIQYLSIEASKGGEDFQEIYKDEINATLNRVERKVEFQGQRYKSLRLKVVGNIGSINRCIRFNNFTVLGRRNIVLSSSSHSSFISHDMSQSDLESFDMSSVFTEKYYAQDKSTELGEGKVFTQPLDVDKIIKSVKVT